MKYLISVQETYRVDTDNEAAALIEQAKHNDNYSLTKYDSTYKEKKKNGDVIDDWYKVKLTKVYDDESEPTGAPVRDKEDF